MNPQARGPVLVCSSYGARRFFQGHKMSTTQVELVRSGKGMVYYPGNSRRHDLAYAFVQAVLVMENFGKIILV